MIPAVPFYPLRHSRLTHSDQLLDSLPNMLKRNDSVPDRTPSMRRTLSPVAWRCLRVDMMGRPAPHVACRKRVRGGMREKEVW